MTDDAKAAPMASDTPGSGRKEGEEKWSSLTAEEAADMGIALGRYLMEMDGGVSEERRSEPRRLRALLRSIAQ